MPHRNPSGDRRLGRILLFSFLAWALVALGRAPRAAAVVEIVPAEPAASPAASVAPTRNRRRRSPRRLALSFVVAVLFFAGASLSAVAGDQAVGLLGEETDAAAIQATETTSVDDPLTEPVETTPPVETEPAPAEPVAAPEPAVEEDEVLPASQGREAAAAAASQPPVAETDVATEAAPAAEVAVVEEQLVPEPAHGTADAPVTAAAPAARPKHAAVRRAAPAKPVVTAPAVRPTPLDPEASAPGFDATVWIHRAQPDPTPQSLRLTPAYASRLVRLSRAAGADWTLVLGVLRADTSRPQAPSLLPTITGTADRLVELGSRRNAWNAALAFTGRTATSDRAVALARYYRAVGIRGLVHGLRAEQERLGEQLLADERVTIYEGGREDIAAGRVDVRVVALIAYLAEAYGQVTVSCLISGHRLYSRPGVISAHVYGAAVDIATLASTSILGHQQPGSVTESAVRDILLLPAELLPRQLISLIGMGGPSFALADHHDHIHVGF